jgi:alcohol dehydrogenase
MRAAIFQEFGRLPEVRRLPDPAVTPDAVIVRVHANGICRSDWHGWMGHDSDVKLPHVPGHELAGVVEEVGKLVRNWRRGDRVTVPFCCGCGHCAQCAAGNQHICDNYFQPGFTAWGSFAELVAIRHADVNLVRLPDALSFVDAAILGCRFITAFRAVVQQGRATAGEWLAVHGCGGVGLSAIMIAHAAGANVLAVDIDDAKLDLARGVGAAVVVNAADVDDLPAAVRELTDGGAHVSLDALGSAVTCRNSILGLRKRGRHVQVGLMLGEHATPALPMGPVIAKELEILGSHGLQAHQMPPLLSMAAAGRFDLAKLVGQRITLDEAPAALAAMGEFRGVGVTVIDRF